MRFIPLFLDGAYLIEPDKHEDNRGFFSRIFCVEEFSKNKLAANLNQGSLSYNKKMGTLRGMHYQAKPFEEDKMVQCIHGKIYDVIVDIRPSSSTYLKWIGVELSQHNNHILYVPKGFAHGFQTLEDDCTLLYLMTEKFNPDASRGFSYKDKSINIAWPIEEKIISEKDKNLSDLSICRD